MNTEKIWNFILSKLGKWLVFVLWALLASNLWLPRNWSFYGDNDWDLTYSMFEAARKSVVEYGQWPLYNPFSSFGYDMVADPQAGQFSIFFLPVLLFGTFYGYKLGILCAMVIGCFGAFKLFKAINPDEKIALLVSLIFCGSAYFSGHLFRAGHSNVMYLYLVPWYLYFLIEFRHKNKFFHLILAILVLAQIIIGGAPIVFLICVAISLLWLVSDFWIYRNFKNIFPLSLVIISAVLLSFWKILPGINLWNETPRLVKDESGISLMQWFQSLGAYPTRMGTWHAWWEYALGFPLVLGGIIFYYRSNIQSIWKWLVLAGIVIWFCMGNAPEYVNPWYWMNKYLPVFSSLRAPSRFGFILLIGLYIALVYVIKSATEKKLLYAILVFGVVAQTFSARSDAGYIEDSQMMNVAQVMCSSEKSEWRTIRTPHNEKNREFLHILNNEMVLNSYQPLVLPKVHDTLRNLFSGVKRAHFTPNAMELEAADSLVVVNQRYSPYWRINGEGKIKYRSGLLSVTGAKGKTKLTYCNPNLATGALWGLLVLPLLGAGYFYWRRR